MKLILLWILFLSLFLVGCVENYSADLCTALKHHSEINDTKVYMDNGYCIIEVEGFNESMMLECKASNLYKTVKINMIFKNSNATARQEFIEGIENVASCEVLEL